MDVPTLLDLRLLIAATIAAGTVRIVSTADAVAANVDTLLGLVSPGGSDEIRMILNEIRAKNWEHMEKKEVLRCVQAMVDLVWRLGTVGDGSGAHSHTPGISICSTFSWARQGGTLEEMVHGVNFATAAAGIIFSGGSDLEVAEPAAETLVNLSKKQDLSEKMV